jgi:hypothetical protein
MDNVIDIFDWIADNEGKPTPYEYELTDTDVFAFLRVLRHIQSMSMSHDVDIQVRTNQLNLITVSETSKGKTGEVTTSTGLWCAAHIEVFLPLLDSLLDDEEETKLIIKSMVKDTTEGINSLHITNG